MKNYTTKQETPIHKVFRILDGIKNAQPQDQSPEALSIRECMDAVIAVIDNHELVEYEKQMFIEAFNVEIYDGRDDNDMNAEQYYKDKFEKLST